MIVARRRWAVLEYAFLASILLHATIAYLIPAFSGLGAPTAPEFISATLMHPITITRQRPHPLALPKRRLESVTRLTPNRTPVRSRTKSTAQHAIATSQTAVRSVAVPGAIASAQQSVIAATPTVAPTATPVATAPSQPQGFMPFGVEQKVPVLDPAVHGALAKLGVHVTLIVTVGDDGRTRTVAFHPPIDASTEAKIRAMLADANWDPSVCGAGLPCEGQATITL